MRTDGVNTHGAAAKVMNFDRSVPTTSCASLLNSVTGGRTGVCGEKENSGGEDVREDECPAQQISEWRAFFAAGLQGARLASLERCLCTNRYHLQGRGEGAQVSIHTSEPGGFPDGSAKFCKVSSQRATAVHIRTFEPPSDRTFLHS